MKSPRSLRRVKTRKKKSSPSIKIMTFIVAENRQPLKLKSDSANPNKNYLR